MISIIIPVFNRPEVFAQTLASVLNQTFKNKEIIVIDDGSNPAIQVEDAQGVQLFSQENKGAAAARNFGFEKSSGEYIFFCDADVLADPRMLQKMWETLQTNPNASYAYCDFYFGKKKMLGKVFDAADLKKNNFISTMSLIRRADFPRFDEHLRKFQDWDLWLTLLEKNKIGAYIPEVLFSVKIGGTMSSWLPSFAYRAPWKWLPGIRHRINVYENARDVIQRKHNI